MPIETHVFRRLNDGRESLVGVECCVTAIWDRLEDRVDDEWIAYQYLGTKAHANTLLEMRRYESVEDLPWRQLSLHAPKD